MTKDAMTMMEGLRTELMELERRSEKKMTPEAMSRYEAIMTAKAGWEALASWMDMPASSQLSEAGVQLAQVGLRLASESGFKADALGAGAAIALRQDKSAALEWLMEQGFNPRTAQAPRLHRGGYHSHWSREGGQPLGWLAAAAQSSAFECARLMAKKGCFVEPKAEPKAGAADAEAAESERGEALKGKPAAKKKSAARVKKEQMLLEELQAMGGLRFGRDEAQWLDCDAQALRETHPLFLVLAGRIDLAPAGFENEILEPQYGLGTNTASAAFRLALAREASNGEPRAMAQALGFGVGPDEGGELAEETLDRCARHLRWAFNASGASPSERRERLASGKAMKAWLSKSGAVERLAASGRTFMDRVLEQLCVSAREECFESRSMEAGLREMKRLREEFSALAPAGAAKVKESLGSPSEAGLAAAREKLTEALLHNKTPYLRSEAEKKHYEELRHQTQAWIEEITLVLGAAAPKRKPLKV